MEWLADNWKTILTGVAAATGAIGLYLTILRISTEKQKRRELKRKNDENDSALVKPSLEDTLEYGHDPAFLAKCRRERNRKGYSASKKGCFVATAVYGDYQHPIVRRFRLFRDTVLIQHRAGRAFVWFYYRLGPILAAVPRNSRFCRSWIRFFLDRLAGSSLVNRKGEQGADDQLPARVESEAK